MGTQFRLLLFQGVELFVTVNSSGKYVARIAHFFSVAMAKSLIDRYRKSDGCSLFMQFDADTIYKVDHKQILQIAAPSTRMQFFFLLFNYLTVFLSESIPPPPPPHAAVLATAGSSSSTISAASANNNTDAATKRRKGNQGQQVSVPAPVALPTHAPPPASSHLNAIAPTTAPPAAANVSHAAAHAPESNGAPVTPQAPPHARLVFPNVILQLYTSAAERKLACIHRQTLTHAHAFAITHAPHKLHRASASATHATLFFQMSHFTIARCIL